MNEVNLLPLTVGFDLRQQDVCVDLSQHLNGEGKVRVRYLHRHREMVFTGSLADAYRELERSGYKTLKSA